MARMDLKWPSLGGLNEFEEPKKKKLKKNKEKWIKTPRVLEENVRANRRRIR